ncbi:MAG: hypothetical protein ACLQLC_06510 [Candidatus Sulfotelmatobacter sp.]
MIGFRLTRDGESTSGLKAPAAMIEVLPVVAHGGGKDPSAINSAGMVVRRFLGKAVGHSTQH